jgi:teichuronic acid biosynthesis glycosyltransferase TuaC
LSSTSKSILYITPCFPSKKNPSHGPFIGYRMKFLQKYGFKTDILSLNYLSFKGRKGLLRIIKYLIILLIPLVKKEKYSFQGYEYSIFRIYYGFISKIWLLIYLLILTKRNKYSLFHYHWLWSTGELSFFKKYLKKTSIITIHGSDIHKTAREDNIAYNQYKKSILSADKIIYVSEALRNIAKSINLATEKDIIIPNGYDPNLFSLTNKLNKELTLGYIGHLIEVKRTDKLPEIFFNVKRRIPNSKLLIVGDGELKNLMVEKFKEYGIYCDVIFIGEVPPDKVANYYEMMDLLLIPSRNEGFGTVAIEARACGVPVIGSSNGGVPEAVGKGGIIVQEGENFEKRYADAVIEFVKNLPSRESIHKGVKGFTWDNIIRKEIRVYKEAGISILNIN